MFSHFAKSPFGETNISVSFPDHEWLWGYFCRNMFISDTEWGWGSTSENLLLISELYLYSQKTVFSEDVHSLLLAREYDYVRLFLKMKSVR